MSDRNQMTGAVRDFGEQSHGTFTDPWITLKRTYSGHRLLLCYLFLAVFLLPYFAQAAFALLRTKIYNDMHQYVPEIRQFDSVENSALWKVLLGYEDGNVAVWLPAILLLFYNIVRTVLTRLVSELVEEEMLSSTTPSYGTSMLWYRSWSIFRDFSRKKYEYGWMYRIHQLLSYVFWLVVIFSSLNLLQLLMTPVPILHI